MVLGCTAAPAVPPARDLDFFISTGISAVFGPWPGWPSATVAEAHAGIAFYAPDFFGYNKPAEGKKPLTAGRSHLHRGS
jgi:hypothetical protein